MSSNTKTVCQRNENFRLFNIIFNFDKITLTLYFLCSPFENPLPCVVHYRLTYLNRMQSCKAYRN